MRKWALVLFFAAGLGTSDVRADDTSPVTLPAEAGRPVKNGPATVPAATQSVEGSPAPTIAPATEPATTSAVDALAGSTTSPSTQPTTSPVATTGPTTSPTTSPVATTGPTTSPTTSPVATTAPTRPGDADPAGRASFAVATSRILPRDFSILAERSIFQKGSHVTRVVERSRSLPGSSVAATAPTKSAAPEESLVFEGATETADRFLATR